MVNYLETTEHSQKLILLGTVCIIFQNEFENLGGYMRF